MAEMTIVPGEVVKGAERRHQQGAAEKENRA